MKDAEYYKRRFPQYEVIEIGRFIDPKDFDGVAQSERREGKTSKMRALGVKNREDAGCESGHRHPK